MKKLQAIRVLRAWDKKGWCVFTKHMLAKLYDILFALDQENLLDQLTFQGGTTLRLGCSSRTI